MKSLKRILCVITIFIVIISFRNYQSNSEKSLLWEISGNGLESPSYLFGTIHLIPKDSFYFPDFMQHRLEESDFLVTEISMDIPMKEQVAIAQRMMLPYGKTFIDYMSTDEYSNFESFLVDSLSIKQMKVNAFVKINPVFVPGLILNELVLKPTAYEMELSRIARKNKLETDFLETIYEQLDILEKIEIEDAFDYFSSDFDIRGEYEELLNKYLAGDIYSIYEDIKNDTTFESYESTLLFERNKKWIPKIDSMINKNVCFIAVGAGHLPGKEGLIQLLQHEGYVVKPMND